MLGDASAAELELARSLARTLIGGLSALARITDAIGGRDNAAGFGWVCFIADEPSVPVLVVRYWWQYCVLRSFWTALNLCLLVFRPMSCLSSSA